MVSESEVVCLHRLGYQTRIASNDVERDFLVGCILKIKFKSAADGGVEEAETIFSWLNLEVGPGLSVNMNDIAEE